MAVTSPPASNPAVAECVRGWRHDLGELGGRNPLLWYRDLPLGTLDLSTAHPGGVSMLMAGRATRLSDLVREPSAFAEARRKADAIYAKTVEMLDEHGIDVAFMAVGLAGWSVPGLSERSRPQAPVLLRSCNPLPVGIAAEDYDLDLRGEVMVNPVLLQYLTDQAGIAVSVDHLTALANPSRQFDPVPVFRELTRLCGRLPGFRVADRKILSTFPLGKLSAVLDLDDPERFATHEVIRALADPAGSGPVRQEARARQGRVAQENPQPARGDEPVSAEELPADPVLDTDAAQQEAVDLVRNGHHLALRTPPGTGATQTIANVVAALAADGRRVLLVSEKRASLRAVVNRLDRVGLAHLVLDVRDGLGERHRIARDGVSAMDRHVAPGRDLREAREQRRRHAAQLDAHRDSVHAPRSPWGVSVFEAQSALALLAREDDPPLSRVRLTGDTLHRIDRDRVSQLGELLGDAVAAGAWDPAGPDPDPWFDARVLSADDAVRTQTVAARAANDFDAACKALDSSLVSVGLPEATTPADWGCALDLMTRSRQVNGTFLPAVLEQPLDRLIAATGGREARDAYRAKSDTPLRWWTRWSLRRQAKALVKPGVHVPDLHQALVEVDDLRTRWAQVSSPQNQVRPADDLDAAQRTWEALHDDLSRLGERLATTVAGGDLLGTPVPRLRERLRALAARPDRLAVLPQVIGPRDRLAEAGLDPLVRDLADRRVAPDRVADEFEFVWWASVLDEVAETDPTYGDHNGTALRSVVAEYVRLDQACVRGAADEVLARVHRRLTDVRADHPDQERALRSAAAARTRPLSVSQLLSGAEDVLLAATPCVAMSPLVVASQLPPGLTFDVVVVEGAAHIPPAHVVSAIARAGQVVLVGDPQQPPAVPFSVTAGNEPMPGAAGLGVAVAAASPAAIEDAGTSLFDVLAPLLPSRSLSTHYRSTDERLVAFANTHMYRGEVLTLPAAGSDSPVRLVALAPGNDLSGEAQAPGGPAEAGVAMPARGVGAPDDVTAHEVARVVRLAVDHAVRRPGESVGIVTMRRAEAQRISRALRAALQTHPDPGVIAFFDPDRPEPVLVKEVDRMHGDVRDAVILVLSAAEAGSRIPSGRWELLDGQRLALATTRARRRLTVVSDLAPDDADDRDGHLIGAFLRYVETGGNQPVVGSDGPVGVEPREPDPLVGELAARLRQEGLTVHEGYGKSRQPIDLVVEDPYASGRHIVAVETDGPGYLAAASVRDRERTRPEQLRRLGWEYVRVWGTDVFRDPARDVARVLEAVRSVDVRSAWSSARRGRQT